MAEQPIAVGAVAGAVGGAGPVGARHHDRGQGLAIVRTGGGMGMLLPDVDPEIGLCPGDVRGEEQGGATGQLVGDVPRGHPGARAQGREPVQVAVGMPDTPDRRLALVVGRERVLGRENAVPRTGNCVAQVLGASGAQGLGGRGDAFPAAGEGGAALINAPLSGGEKARRRGRSCVSLTSECCGGC